MIIYLMKLKARTSTYKIMSLSIFSQISLRIMQEILKYYNPYIELILIIILYFMTIVLSIVICCSLWSSQILATFYTANQISKKAMTALRNKNSFKITIVVAFKIIKQICTHKAHLKQYNLIVIIKFNINLNIIKISLLKIANDFLKLLILLCLKNIMCLNFYFAYPVLTMRHYMTNTLHNFLLRKSAGHILLQVFYNTGQIHAINFSQSKMCVDKTGNIL